MLAYYIFLENGPNILLTHLVCKGSLLIFCLVTIVLCRFYTFLHRLGKVLSKQDMSLTCQNFLNRLIFSLFHTNNINNFLETLHTNVLAFKTLCQPWSLSTQIKGNNAKIEVFSMYCGNICGL